MDNFVKIQIPYKSSMASIILGYTATFNTTDNFRCENTKIIDSKEELDIEVGLGITEIKYKDEDIIIDFKQIGDPVGLYFSADVYKILIVKIKYENKDEIEKKKKVIREYINEAREYFDMKEDDEIICKILGNNGWKNLTRLPKRSFDTIYLPKKQKDRVYNDLKKFFDLKEEYRKLGIPWKRNYLFEGAPGTGKTSLIYSLASEFNLNIYIINLGPKVDDSVFMSAISHIPKNSILLLEDIDALFVERKSNDNNKSLVSFSGILNVLDGMARKDGLIVFMTTNYKEHLDKALIRPSRIDFTISFDKCNKEQIIQMFNKFFADNNNFDVFYKKIKNLELRICILQQFFMECKFNGEELMNIDRIKDIIKEMDNTKKPKGNLYM